MHAQLHVYLAYGCSDRFCSSTHKWTRAWFKPLPGNQHANCNPGLRMHFSKRNAHPSSRPGSSGAAAWRGTMSASHLSCCPASFLVEYDCRMLRPTTTQGRSRP